VTRFQVLIEDTVETYFCADTRTLLEGMEALGRKGIPVGCRGGGCGVCKVRINKGRVRTEKMSRTHVTADEESQGVVLACRAYPLSDVNLSAIGKMALCLERSQKRSFLDGLIAQPAGLSNQPKVGEQPDVVSEKR
jgi:ferredoxin